MAFELLDGYERQEEILSLFTEYTQMLVEMNPVFAHYLEIQNYAAEIADLEHKYGRPAGRLYLALCEGQPAGCIALRKLDDERGELKRLYVRPAFRGRGLGGLLTERIIADAREIGYRYLLLDTQPPLRSAIRMYRGMGFTDIPCYNDSPIGETLFMQLAL